MKKSFFLKSLLLACCFFTISCNSSLTVEKRQYRQGYYVSFSTKYDQSKMKSSTPNHFSQNLKVHTKAVSPNNIEAVESVDTTAFFENPVETKNTILKQHESIKQSKQEVNNQKVTISPSVKNSITKTKENKNNFKWAIAFSAIAGLFSLTLALRKGRSKKISRWANKNKTKARIALVFSHGLLSSCAYFMGKLMADNHIFTSDLMMKASLGLGIASIAAYPFKKSQNKFFKHSYFKQKMADSLIILSTFLSVLSFSSDHHKKNMEQISNPMSQQISGVTINNVDETTSDEKKEGHLGAQIGLFLLLTIAVCFAAAGISVLSCSLACSGNELGALVLFMGGGYALLLTYVLLARYIFYYYGKSKVEKDEMLNKKEDFLPLVFLLPAVACALVAFTFIPGILLSSMMIPVFLLFALGLLILAMTL